MQDFQSPYSSDSTGPFSSRCIDFEFHISNRWRQDDGHILHFTLDSSVKSIRWRSCLQKQDVARKSSVLGSDIMHFSFCTFGGAMGVRASEGELIFQNLPKLGLVGLGVGWNCAAGVYWVSLSIQSLGSTHSYNYIHVNVGLSKPERF